MNRRRFVAASMGSAAVALLARPLLWAQGVADPYHVKWMKEYAGERTHYLRTDPRFARFVAEHLGGLFIQKARLDRWADRLLLVGGTVTVVHNRYVAATGSLMHFGYARAMLWVDTHFDPSAGAQPTVLFAAMDGHGNRGRGTNCWVIANQELGDLMAEGVPHKVKPAFQAWLRERPLRVEGKIAKMRFNGPSRQPSFVLPEIFHVPASRIQG